MPFHKRPPRGYTAQDHPLPHNFEYHGGLSAEPTKQHATILTLLRQSEVITNVDQVVVNPSHTSFAEETGATIAPGSIIPKLQVSLNFTMTKLGIETDKIKTLNIQVYPIYTAFLDTLEAQDVRAANSQIEDIMELQHGTASKATFPLFNGTDLAFQTVQPLNTVLLTEAFGAWGLTVDAKLEGVSWAEPTYHDALDYYSNQGMLRKVVGRAMNFTVKQDHPARFFSHNFTNPMVKRANPYTMCALLIHLRSFGTLNQYGRVGDATAIDHIDFSCGVRYDEWNNEFDQTAFV